MRLTMILLLSLMATIVCAEPVDRVVLVSIDGLRADLLVDLLDNDLAGDYANFQRLVTEGASTFNGRTDFTHTVTLPNHTCMVTGRPVLQPAGQPDTIHHGYTRNTSPDSLDTLHNMGNPAVSYIASVFDVAHDHGLTTALFASKSKFIIFDQSYDALQGAPDLTGPDDGVDKIDLYHQESSGSPGTAGEMHTALMAQLANDPPQFSFVHYRDLDSAGHASDWGSPAWIAAVQVVDGYLGDILDFVAANPGLMGRTVVIVTADHGGSGSGHSDATNPDMYTVPFFAWGADVVVGADLYALNSGHRADPAGGRPDYNEPVAPIRNGDSGNLALSLLGLPAITGSVINAAQDLVVTHPDLPGTTGPNIVSVNAYPNPFNGRLVLSYELQRAANVSIAVFDMSGRLTRVLETGDRDSGQHQVAWDGCDDSGRGVASGVYFYRVAADDALKTGQLAFVR